VSSWANTHAASFFSLNEFCNTNLDIIAHRTNLIQGTTYWDGQWPFIAAKARNVGSFVAATHGDEQERIVCKLLGQHLGRGGPEINANPLRDGKNLRMHVENTLALITAG
jgi:hypothetical protein